jgi:hypothetical protein
MVAPGGDHKGSWHARDHPSVGSLLPYEDEIRSVEGPGGGLASVGSSMRCGSGVRSALLVQWQRTAERKRLLVGLPRQQDLRFTHFAQAPRQPPVGRGGWLAGVNPFWKDSLAYDKRSRS